MSEMNITSAQYLISPITGATDEDIEAVIDGNTYTVAAVPGNRHYDEIQRQVAAGELTIQDAD